MEVGFEGVKSNRQNVYNITEHSKQHSLTINNFTNFHESCKEGTGTCPQICRLAQ